MVRVEMIFIVMMWFHLSIIIVEGFGWKSSHISSFLYHLFTHTHIYLTILFSVLQDREKTDQLNEILSGYSANGLPSWPPLLALDRVPFDEKVFQLEPHWSCIVDNASVSAFPCQYSIVANGWKIPAATLNSIITHSLNIPSSLLPDGCNKGRGMCYPVCLHRSVLSVSVFHLVPFPTGVTKVVVCAILSVCIGQCFPCQYSIQSPSGARCSSVVRAFAHGAMGHRVNPSWWSEM